MLRNKNNISSYESLYCFIVKNQIMNWIKDRNRRTGIIITVAVHLLLVLILSFMLLEPPFPPPTQLGVEVNLGNSNQGMGDVQPETPNQQTLTPKQTYENIEKIATQQTEESVNIKKKVNDRKVEKQEPTEPVIDDRFKFKSNTNKTGGHQGQTGNPGDQGMQNGDPNANNYVGDGGAGGVSFELKGRNVKSLNRPAKVPNQEGRVVVKIWVDKMGKVINANQDITRSTTTNSVLVQQSLNAAYASEFDNNPNALEVQTGFITYIYTL